MVVAVRRAWRGARELRKSACCNFATASAAKAPKLRLIFGADGVPKAEGDRGEDAWFASHAESAFGIADGAGSWTRHGVDAGRFSRELLRGVSAQVARSARSMLKPNLEVALQTAFQATLSESIQGSGPERKNSTHIPDAGSDCFLVAYHRTRENCSMINPTKVAALFGGLFGSLWARTSVNK